MARHRCLGGLEGYTELSVVDAQALAQDGSGVRVASSAESGAHDLGERGRRCGSTVDDRQGWCPLPESRSRIGSGVGAAGCSALQLAHQGGIECRRGRGCRPRRSPCIYHAWRGLERPVSLT